MDCFLATPLTGCLSSECWGAADVGARDQDNGLEDRFIGESNAEGIRYCYWDGAVFRDEERNKFVMFASRWNESDGHKGWPRSQAIYAESDSLFGPYEDKGLLYPNIEGGYGHNVFPLRLSPAENWNGHTVRYAIVLGDTFVKNLKGGIFVAEKLRGPWEFVGQMRVDAGKGVSGEFALSNVGIVARPEGGYLAYNRNGDLATAQTIFGPWTMERSRLWNEMPLIAHKHDVEDPVIWYSDDRYHCLVNRWDERRAYYLTSGDGITDWKMRKGVAYAPNGNMIRYNTGEENHWNKLERPNVYMEEGKVCAITLSVIDVPKDEERGNDAHGSKIVVIPFDGDALSTFDKDENTVVR